MLEVKNPPWKTKSTLIKRYKLPKDFNFELVRTENSLYYEADVFSILQTTKIFDKPVERYINKKEVIKILKITMETFRERLKREWYVNVRYFKYKDEIYYFEDDIKAYQGYNHRMLETAYSEFLIDKKYNISAETVLDTLPKEIVTTIKASSLLDSWLKTGLSRGWITKEDQKMIKKLVKE